MERIAILEAFTAVVAKNITIVALVDQKAKMKKLISIT